jgi:hypothetical protein
MEKVMAATARLTALASVAGAAALALSVPLSEVSGLAYLIAWTATAVLAGGLIVGFRSAVTAATVSLVIVLALVSTFETPSPLPLWAFAGTLVLTIETASASFVYRTRVPDPLSLITRMVSTPIMVALGTQVLALLLRGAEATGSLVRVAGVASVVIAAGWVAKVWRRSVESLS